MKTMQAAIAVIEPKIGNSPTMAERWEHLCKQLDVLRAREQTLAIQAQAVQTSVSRQQEVWKFLKNSCIPRWAAIAMRANGCAACYQRSTLTANLTPQWSMCVSTIGRMGFSCDAVERREVRLTKTKTSSPRVVPLADVAIGALVGTSPHTSQQLMEGGWIRTNVGVRQRIYRSARRSRPGRSLSFQRLVPAMKLAGRVLSDPDVGTGWVERGARPTRLVRPGDAPWSQGGGPSRIINTPDPSDGWRQMEITEEWIEDDEGVMARRARARNLLPDITQEVKQALKEAGIEMDVFLMIPMSGDALATFGTIIDPPDEVWVRVGEIVCAVLGRTVGLGPVRCGGLACATTADQMTSQRDLRADPDTNAYAAFGCGSRDPMRYRDIQPTDVRLPRGYPVLAEVNIDPVDWFRFEQMVGDTPVTKIIGHDDPLGERLLVHVACASTSVRDRLRDGWE